MLLNEIRSLVYDYSQAIVMSESDEDDDFVKKKKQKKPKKSHTSGE